MCISHCPPAAAYLPEDQVKVFHQAVDALRGILKKKYKLSDSWWPDEEITRKQDLLVNCLGQNRLSLACLFPDYYSVETFPSGKCSVALDFDYNVLTRLTLFSSSGEQNQSGHY